MSLRGDIVREADVLFLAELISNKIDGNAEQPEAVRVLKELGREVLNMLPNIPDWSRSFRDKFRQ